jgi:hypothetical protein
VVDAVEEEEGEKGEGRCSVLTCSEGSAGALVVERGELATGARSGRPERNDDDDELDPFGERAAALGGKPCRSLVGVGA